MSVKVFAIAAMDEGRIIGKEGKLPWHLPQDMKRFSDLTRGHSVLMGRKTFDSIPLKFKPLPERKNIVVSKSLPEGQQPGFEVWSCPIKCIEACKEGKLDLPSSLLWVIGGEEIYKATLHFWDELYLTLVDGKHAGDAFFPYFEDSFKLMKEEKAQGFVFRHFVRN